MNPPRLLASGTHKARALLLAARGELPRPETERAVLAALALSPVVVVAPSLAAQIWPWLKHLARSKAGVAAWTVAAASGGFVAGQRHERRAQSLSTPVVHEVVAKVQADTPEVIAPDVATAPHPRIAPQARIAPVALAKRALPLVAATPIAPSPPEPASLSDELEALQRTQRALNAGDGATAVVELDVYADAHPHGALEEEALGLRVRALRLLDNKTGAERTLAELARRFPDSIYLTQLRASNR